MNNTRIAIELLAATPHVPDPACVLEILGILLMGILLDLIESPVTVLILDSINPPDIRDLKGYRRKILRVRTRARIAKSLGNHEKSKKLSRIASGMSRCEENISSKSAREWVEELFNGQENP